MPLTIDPDTLDLGGLEPCICREHIGWLNTWPGHEALIQDLLAGYPLGGAEMQARSDDEHFQLLTMLLNGATDSVQNLPVGYHGKDHFWQVTWTGGLIMETQQSLTGIPLPSCIVQCQDYADAEHDESHPGAMFRTMATRGLPSLARPDLGFDVSVEWVTSIMADAKLRAQGIHPLQRLLDVLLILVTTYGKGFPEGKRLKLEVFAPEHWLEYAIVVADLAKPYSGLPAMWDEVQLQFGSVSVTPVPVTWKDFFANWDAFAAHARTQFALLDKRAEVPISVALGLGDVINRQQQIYQAVREGRDPRSKAILANMLHNLGVKLL